MTRAGFQGDLSRGKFCHFWKKQKSISEWRVEISKLVMKRKIWAEKPIVNDSLAEIKFCMGAQAQIPPAQLWPYKQNRAPEQDAQDLQNLLLQRHTWHQEMQLHCGAAGGSQQQQGWSPGPLQLRQPTGWTAEREQWWAKLFFHTMKRLIFILYYLSPTMRCTDQKISVHERGTSAKQGFRILPWLNSFAPLQHWKGNIILPWLARTEFLKQRNIFYWHKTPRCIS